MNFRFFVFIFIFFNVINVSIFGLAKDYLFFNGQSLQLKDAKGKVLKNWTANAGSPRAAYKDQSKKNIGPLPEGKYIVREDIAISFHTASSLKQKLKWIIKSPAWGFEAVPLEPFLSNRMYHRDNFYIHGGGWFIGSKGCIYLKDQNKNFQDTLKQYHTNLVLHVKYPPI